MCSCHEWIMYFDRRDRWIYDHQLKRIAVTVNQEVLVKSCYNSQPWTQSRCLLVLPPFSPMIREQESFTFQPHTKWPKIAQRLFSSNIDTNAFKHKQLEVPLPHRSVSTWPPPSPHSWQMDLINIDMITRFPAINTHSSYGFKCWGFQIIWLTAVGMGASGRWFEMEEGWSNCEVCVCVCVCVCVYCVCTVVFFSVSFYERDR